MEALEEQAVRGTGPETIARIRAVKRDLLALRRITWPQRDALNWLLREQTPLIAADTQPYLRDCYDHVSRIIDTLETYRELASDLLAAHLSAVSNQMNAVMKTLTIMASIFIPLTFVAGLYGMNLKMPETRWDWAYPAVLGVMAAVGVGMVAYFKRKKWI
jgi:magnesium transporter